MSARSSSKLPPDSKAVVSFNSDSEDEESSSSASRLSSSASSGEDSEVETVTFSVPMPASSQGQLKSGPGQDKSKSTKVSNSVTQDQQGSSTVNDSRGKDAGLAAKSRLSPKNFAGADDNEVSTTKSSKTARKLDNDDDLPVLKSRSVVSERAKSPKITINDVDGEDKKKKKYDADDDVIATKKRSSPKKTQNDAEDDVIVTKTRSSPKKAPNDAEDDVITTSSKTSKRGGSPRKADSENDVETVKPRKSSSRLASTEQREESPKITVREHESSLTDQTVSRSTTDDTERQKSTRKPREDGSETETTKSTKKTSEDKDSKSKSLKNSSGDREIERAKSPKKSSEVTEVARDKSPKISSSGEPNDVSEQPRRSKIKQEELQEPDGKEGLEEVTKVKKSKKSSKAAAKEDNDVKVVAEKDDDVGFSKSEKTKYNIEDLLLKKDYSKASTEDTEDPIKSSKSELSDFASKSEKSKTRQLNDLALDDEPKRKKEAELEPGLGELPNHKTDEDEGKPVRVTTRNLENVDTSKPSSSLEESKTVKKEAAASGATEDKDYMKLPPESRQLESADGAGRKPELENEDSEFTYRRKSMDEFIKRILAEAKEERLKQKQTVGGASEENEKPGKDKYGELNGDVSSADDDLSGHNWTRGTAKDKEASNLDKRLASIEKRRFGAAKGGGELSSSSGVRTKNDKEPEGDETTSKTKISKNDANDFDMNLDEDLEEINRFLQSRKSAASRFDFDEAEVNNSTPGLPSAGKRHWLPDNEEQQQPQQPIEDNGLPPSGAKTGQVKKKQVVEADFNDEDEGRFLSRFRVERESVLPEDDFKPRRRDETTEIVRERTRNVRVLVDQQVEIVQAMRSTSKNLDDLEKEIREVRQVCLDRQARIESLEGQLHAECRAFENDQLAASDRQKSTEALKDDIGLPPLGRLRRQDKLKSESLDEESFPFRRRSGSVASTTSLSSGFAPGGRSAFDPFGDPSDLRPPSGLRQQKAPDFRRTESESDYPGFDRRRGGSVNRDRIGDASSFGLDDASALLTQRPARSRASIATSTPAVDITGTASGDSFLAKIRAKYSFLAPTIDNASISGSLRAQSSFSPSPSDSRYSSSSSSRRYGFEDSKSRTRDILTSPSTYSALSSGGYSRYSISDSRSPSYSSYGGGVGGGGYTGLSSVSGGSLADASRMRRAQSVTETSFDRPFSAQGLSGAPPGMGGSEFHSRFLDKVREKKAMGDEVTVPPKAAQEKPFKSRFLKQTSFDGSSSKSDRMTNGLDNDDREGSDA